MKRQVWTVEEIQNVLGALALGAPFGVGTERKAYYLALLAVGVALGVDVDRRRVELPRGQFDDLGKGL